MKEDQGIMGATKETSKKDQGVSVTSH